jgi:hypothetical protein
MIIDDQVRLFCTPDDIGLTVLSFKSIRLVNCREFRELLLLLWINLKIPHRTKLRDMVVEAWRRYFVDLWCDIEVSHSFMFLLFSNLHCPERCRPGIVHS